MAEKHLSVNDEQQVQSKLSAPSAGLPGFLQDGAGFTPLDSSSDGSIQPFPRSPKLQRKVAKDAEPSQVNMSLSRDGELHQYTLSLFRFLDLCVYLKSLLCWRFLSTKTKMRQVKQFFLCQTPKLKSKSAKQIVFIIPNKKRSLSMVPTIHCKNE